MKLLIVEDDADAASMLTVLLRERAATIVTAPTGTEAIEAIRRHRFDLVLLDLVLPDMSGCDLLRSMRRQSIDTPVVVLSGLESTAIKVECLTGGADDYVTKPFAAKELLARISTVLRRSQAVPPQVIKTGDLVINLETRSVSINETPVKLTNKEYQIIELLSLRKGAIISKQQLVQHLYRDADEPNEKIIDVFVCGLRKKISDLTNGGNCIANIRGQGYELREITVRTSEAV